LIMATVKVYAVSGRFKDSTNTWRKFRIEVTAISELS